MANTINKTKQLGFLRSLVGMQRVMMEQGALQNYQRIILENARNHRSAEEIINDEDFNQPFLHEIRCYNSKGAQTRQLYISESRELLGFNEDGELTPMQLSEGSEVDSGASSEKKEQRVLVLHCEGPVTRGGGFCSYGSIDYRDILKEYADDPDVAGFVFETNTPGGDAMAMYDFEEGMAAWRAAGKRSIQHVDGNCFSAGEAMGCQCDYQIAQNAHNGFGCVGAMVSGYITPANAENDITHERFLHIVANQTPDKNAMWEKAANGDTEEVQAWVSESAQEFIDMMTTCRPDVKPEHLTGKTYNASAVIGSLCDGIGSIDDAIHYCLTGECNWQSGVESEATDDDAVVDDPEKDIIPEDDDKPEDEQADQKQITLNSKDMNLLQRIAIALGIKDEEEMPAEQAMEQPAETQESGDPETQDGGTPESRDPENNDGGTPESRDSETQDAETTESSDAGITAPSAEEQLASLMAEVSRLNSEMTDLSATIAKHKDEKKLLEDKVSMLDSVITELNASVDAVSKERDELKAILVDCKTEIEAKDAELANLKEEVTLLKEVGAAPQVPSPAPEATESADQFAEAEEQYDPMGGAQAIIATAKKRASRRSRK